MYAFPLVFAPALLLSLAAASGRTPEEAPRMDAPFVLEALVDFPDDAITAGQPITAAHIDSMMAELARLGVRRVQWAYYGDGHGGYLLPSGLDEPTTHWGTYAATLDALGSPLRVAAEAAHRHGLQIHAYYKPYETGIAMILPEGSPAAREWGRLRQIGGYVTWLDPFVLAHPELRIRRRASERGASDRPITALRLTKSDAAPTRVTQEHLQIWVSDRNWQYRRLEQPFRFEVSIVRSDREVRDLEGRVVTPRGAEVRTLTLSGLNLTDPYVLVTTDVADGAAGFRNTGVDMLSALDSRGREIPGVFATGGSIWTPGLANFRTGGLMFDLGFGRAATALDEPNGSGSRGFIAFARGRNEALPGALCETEPAVQEYWLACIREMLDAGVDGVDLRVENHSTHTDYPSEYGFNPVVLRRCGRTGGDARRVARVRGEAYTDFVRRAKRLIASRGMRLRANLNVDWFRPDPPESRRLAYPANVDFDWRTWVTEGLLDEGVLRIFALPFDAVFADKVAQEMVSACRKRGIPVTVNRYVQPGRRYLEEFERVRRDGRFSGFVLYETESFMAFDKTGGCKVTNPVIEEIGKAVRTGASCR